MDIEMSVLCAYVKLPLNLQFYYFIFKLSSFFIILVPIRFRDFDHLFIDILLVGNVLNYVLWRLQFFRIHVRNFESKLILHRHNDFNMIEWVHYCNVLINIYHKQTINNYLHPRSLWKCESTLNFSGFTLSYKFNTRITRSLISFKVSGSLAEKWRRVNII